MSRPYYARALEALNRAHDACYRAWEQNPNRDAIGMSIMPFGGVNIALGIVDELETRLTAAEARIKQLEGLGGHSGSKAESHSHE